MSAPDRSFVETPLFHGLDAASFSYAFELVAYRKGTGEPVRNAFRLGLIADHLAADDHGGSKVFSRLIAPSRSFLDDVTTGPPGTNGRPLLFAASGLEADDPSRVVSLNRNEAWRYEFEGQLTELAIPEARRRIEMRLRDGFCAFESGRLYYVLTLTLPSPAPPALDEYGVIQLQQLTLDPARAADANYLSFDWAGGAGLSLVGLANARLESLRSRAGPDDVNGMLDVIGAFGLLAEDERHVTLTPEHLRGLCVAIDNEMLLEAAEYATGYFPAEPPPPSGLAAAETQWAHAAGASKAAGAPPHVEDANPYGRALLAFSGLAQGVPDFPYQDGSEIHDSTRPTAASVDASLYVHPRFMFEVGRSWRSFAVARPELGTCPYLMLTWLIALHYEATVADMERRIDEMVYGIVRRPETAAGRRASGRSDPLADLLELRRSASKLFGRRMKLQEANIAERLELFRWAAIDRSGSVFRYPKEKAAQMAVRAAMGSEERFAEAHATLDRYRDLVENVSTLATSYAEKRVDRLLAILSLFGVIAFPKVVKEFGETTGVVVNPLAATAVVVAVLLAVFLFGRFDRR
jgi:hypothetical protein